MTFWQDPNNAGMERPVLYGNSHIVWFWAYRVNDDRAEPCVVLCTHIDERAK